MPDRLRPPVEEHTVPQRVYHRRFDIFHARRLFWEGMQEWGRWSIAVRKTFAPRQEVTRMRDTCQCRAAVIVNIVNPDFLNYSPFFSSKLQVLLIGDEEATGPTWRGAFFNG